MSNNKCTNCYFFYKCREHIYCDAYSPLQLEQEKDLTVEIVEQNRMSYYKEWFNYISEYNDFF